MMSMFGIWPQIVAVSSQSGFLHLIQCLPGHPGPGGAHNLGLAGLGQADRTPLSVVGRRTTLTCSTVGWRDANRE
jgi:hypothetical protein